MSMILPLALVAIGADSVTGKWVLEFAGRQQSGPSQLSNAQQQARSAFTVKPDTLDLKADGAMLTGSVTHHGFIGYAGSTPPPPQVTPISSGKVDGSHIYFEETRELGGRTFKWKYEGSVSGDRIDLNRTTIVPAPPPGYQSDATHLVAKRLGGQAH